MVLSHLAGIKVFATGGLGKFSRKIYYKIPRYQNIFNDVQAESTAARNLRWTSPVIQTDIYKLESAELADADFPLADLRELGRTPVAVISSGCKSFLDIPRTLEFLETEGVGVATFADGRTGNIDFPGFFTRDSGVKTPLVVQDENEAARMICKSYIDHFRNRPTLRRYMPSYCCSLW